MSLWEWLYDARENQQARWLMAPDRMTMAAFGAALTQALSQQTHTVTDGAAALLRALAQGDEGALELAYRTHREAVWAFARRLVGEDAAAEDLVHEVFVRLPTAMRRFRGEATLQTFLIGMAVNHARHHVRAAARRRSAARRLAQEPREITLPHDPVEASQLAAALTLALDDLPIDQRVAFVLCHVDERSYSEAAQLVGAAEGTVRARVFHARKRLRASLEHWQRVEQTRTTKGMP